jgi:hypothetical protein
MHRAACALAIGLLVVVEVTACGRAKPDATSVPNHATSPVAALQTRLRAGGYTVKDDVTFGGPLPAAEGAFSVRDVDYASPHSFSVAVYAFGSRAAASRFVNAVYATLASVANGRALMNERLVRIVGAHVYLAFTEMDGVICSYFGLCAGYPSYGVPTCRMTAAGALRCTPVPGVALAGFRKLVSTAEGG